MNENFIEKAINVHGNKYEYSDVEYINGTTKVKIWCFACSKHFMQAPYSHLQGAGCPDCGKKNRAISNAKPKNKFIEEAVIKHGNKYKYDDVIYINSKLEVKIWCITCNEYFMQTPFHHLRSGCWICGVNKRAKTQTKTKEQFIEDAIAIHGNKYEYSEVEYVGNKTGVKIWCFACDKYFWQIPNSHLLGFGCKDCGDKLKPACKPKTKEQFIEDAIAIHGNKYEYSDVEYVNSRTKVKIWCFSCSKHFWQAPCSHLNGYNCKRCCLNGHSKKSIRWLKIMQNEYKDIEHAENKEEFRIPGTNFKADGWSPHTKTIFEFLGCYWHGCLCFENRDEINRVNKMTMQQLYDYTMERERIIKELGYNIISIWECEFDEKYN
jgi:Zn finger protein HypA/HybF involved in hydrogenase expression